jgi:hypothetical protein
LFQTGFRPIPLARLPAISGALVPATGDRWSAGTFDRDVRRIGWEQSVQRSHQGAREMSVMAVVSWLGSVRFGASVTIIKHSLRAPRSLSQIPTAAGLNVSTELLIPASLARPDGTV